MVSASFNNREFFRVGYFVNVLYADDELNLNPPQPPLVDQLGRLVMTDNPRVTNFPIEWETDSSNVLGIVPPENLENYNPETGFGYTEEQRKEMMMQDRKNMFSEENVKQAAEAMKNPFSEVTNQ